METPILKYEVFILKCHSSWLDERLAEKQSEGWEIAGDILIRENDTFNQYISIPLKRILK